jgi:hypothetical protein
MSVDTATSTGHWGFTLCLLIRQHQQATGVFPYVGWYSNIKPLGFYPMSTWQHQQATGGFRMSVGTATSTGHWGCPYVCWYGNIDRPLGVIPMSVDIALLEILPHVGLTWWYVETLAEMWCVSCISQCFNSIPNSQDFLQSECIIIDVSAENAEHSSGSYLCVFVCRVRKQVVNIPSYVVRLDSQKHIDFSLRSPYGGGRPGQYCLLFSCTHDNYKTLLYCATFHLKEFVE